MITHTFSTIVVSILTLASSALALPANVSPADVSPLEKRFDLTCQDNGGGYRPVGEAQACVNYLFNKGTTHCVVDGTNVIFCRAGNTVITGSNISGGPSASSHCVDVAWGAQDIIDSCTTPDGWVGGAAAARGNGGLVVAINWG